MEFLDGLDDTNKDANSVFTFNEIGGDDSNKNNLPFGLGSKSSVSSHISFINKDPKGDFSVCNDTQKNNPLCNMDFLNTISEVPESNNNFFTNHQDFGNLGESSKIDIDFLNSEMVNNKNASQSNFAFSQFQENNNEDKINFNINNFMNSSKRSNFTSVKENENEISETNMNKKNEIRNNNVKNVINVKINNTNSKNISDLNNNINNKNNINPINNNIKENEININANNKTNKNLDSITFTQLIQSDNLNAFDNNNNINNNQNKENTSTNLNNLIPNNKIEPNSTNTNDKLNTININNNNIQTNKNHPNNNKTINEKNNKNNQIGIEKQNNTNINKTTNNTTNTTNTNNINNNINVDLLRLNLMNLPKIDINKDKLNFFSNEIATIFNKQTIPNNNNIISESLPTDIKRKEPNENNKKVSDLKDIDSLLDFAKENPLDKSKNVSNNVNVFSNPLLLNQNIKNNISKEPNKILENLPSDSFDKKNEKVNLSQKEFLTLQQMETSSKNKQKKLNKENISNNDDKQNDEIPSTFEVIKKYNELVVRLNKIREKAKVLRGLAPYFTKLISINENFNIEFPILMYKLLETYNGQTNRLLSLMKMKNYKMSELNEEFDEEIKKYSLAFPDNL